MNTKLALLRVRKILLALLHDTARRALLRHRVLAAMEHSNVINFGYSMVVDVGANRGQFALAVRSLLPECHIISFEPLPAPANEAAVVFGDDQRFELRKLALGHETGKADIHISGKDDSSSLLPISDRQSNTFPGTEEVGRLCIEVVRLDDFLGDRRIPQKSLLKIDTQGFELSVLRGAGRRLSDFSAIYCECSYVELYSGQALASDIVSYLADNGFKLTGVYHTGFDDDGLCLQSDMLFQRAFGL